MKKFRKSLDKKHKKVYNSMIWHSRLNGWLGIIKEKKYVRIN